MFFIFALFFAASATTADVCVQAETQCLATPTPLTNLLVNPDAETGNVDGWDLIWCKSEGCWVTD